MESHMKNMTIEVIANACGGRYFGGEKEKNFHITCITTDSRKTEKGCLFIPISGARADGHDFIPSVFGKQAGCCLSERVLPDMEHPYILVNSTLQAIKDIAEYYRSTLQIKVIGITGSMGKTSSKEVIASVLETEFRVLKTQGNFNNELGLPLTIFRLREEHEVAVLELGISEFGEMHRLSKIAKPDICVITNIGYCHMETLKSREGILKAKSEIFDFMPEGGKVILNGDDDMLQTLAVIHGEKPVFFGLQPGHPVHADHIEDRGLKGSGCDIHLRGEAVTVSIPVPGAHMVYNALAAAAVGAELGVSAASMKRAIESLESVGGRGHIIEHRSLTILDDCYNANPVSMKYALDILSTAKGRKVAVLGDMFELGHRTVELHKEIGIYASEKNIDLILCTGELAKHLAEAAIYKDGNSTIIYTPDLEQLLAILPRMIRKEDTLLVKASHGMHFEKVVEMLREWEV